MEQTPDTTQDLQAALRDILERIAAVLVLLEADLQDTDQEPPAH